MIRKYEIACEEAGLSKEKIKEIEQVFDTQKKNLKYEQAALEKANAEEGLCVLSVSGMLGNDMEGDFEIPDPGMDVHEIVYKKMLIEKLRTFLLEMDEEDRRLLLVFYSGCWGEETRFVEKHGIDRYVAKRRVKKLVKELRTRFADDIKENN